MPDGFSLNEVNNNALSASHSVRTTVNNSLKNKSTAFLSKNFPYFGYIGIKINDLPSFNLFSNNDDVVAQEYFWRGPDSHERTTLKVWSILSKKSRTTFDLGSYTGIFALSAAVSNPKSKIYALEAFNINYARILVNINCNKISNITVLNNAVSDHNRNVELRLKSGDFVLSTGGSISDKINCDFTFIKKVKCMTLENIIRKNKIKSLDLIKIDIEGHELVSLKAFEKSLFYHKPDLIIEVLPTSEGIELYDFLQSGGYNCYHIDEENNSLKLLSRTDVYSDYDSRNWFLTFKNTNDLKSIFRDQIILN